MEIRQLTNTEEKQKVTQFVLEALPEWFGIPEAREEYIRECTNKIFFSAYDKDRPVGFLYLKETGNATIELYPKFFEHYNIPTLRGKISRNLREKRIF